MADDPITSLAEVAAAALDDYRPVEDLRPVVEAVLAAGLEKLLPMQPDGGYTDHESYYVVGGWGVDGDTTRAKAVRHARKALVEYPGCQARVDRCVIRTWDDGSQFIGASETIDLDGEPS